MMSYEMSNHHIYTRGKEEHSVRISFDSILRAKYEIKPVVAVAAAQDEFVLASLRRAVDLGLCRALLVGGADEIRALAAREGIDLGGMEIIPCADEAQACKVAVQLVRERRAQAVMKGHAPTAAILREVLNSDHGLKKSALLSYVGVFELPGIERMIYLTDPALNMYPNLEEKKHIIMNSLRVARALGCNTPVVACLCAIETVNPKMPPTVDAAELVQMNRAGEIEGCVVTGPLALDNCLYREAAIHKGIEDPNAGKADVILAPQIETGNALHKSFAHVAKARHAGVLVGATAPVIITSRADHEDAKLNSIALAVRMANEQAS